jgi:N-methylhydantoinase A
LTSDFLPRVRAVYDELLAEADAALTGDGVPAAARICTLAADLRYQGQNYELTIPVSDDDLRHGFSDLVVRFNDQHRRIYGYQLAGREVQLVNARVSATGKLDHAQWPVTAATGTPTRPITHREVLVVPGSRVEAPVYRFDDLRPAQTLAGPAIVEYRGSTLFVPPDWSGQVDERCNVHLAHASAAEDVDATRAAAREAV